MNTQEIVTKFLAMSTNDRHFVLGYVIATEHDLWADAFAAAEKHKNL